VKLTLNIWYELWEEAGTDVGHGPTGIRTVMTARVRRQRCSAERAE